jgi:hypothetical protein
MMLVMSMDLGVARNTKKMSSGEEGAAAKLLLLLSSEADLAACRKSWKLLSSMVQLLQLGWRFAL